MNSFKKIKSPKKKILVIMTGSIASYKACQVLSTLSKKDCDVKVVLTKSAQNFIGDSTIEGLTGNSPYKDLYESGSVMEHIYLARWADLILVAPATANFINKISQGLADDLASTIFLAYDFSKPFLVVPAMNTSMYKHPVTQKSIKALTEIGIQILETASGVLACGEVGWGKLLEPDLIVQQVDKALQTKTIKLKSKNISKSKSNVKKVLITYGGTVEKIDDVRVIANTSSGQTGSFITNCFLQMGYEPTVLRAKSAALSSIEPESEKIFLTTDDLLHDLKNELKTKHYDVIIHLAAVSDFKLKKSFKGKLSSTSNLNLELIKNTKIINQIKGFSKNRKIKLIGFKLLSNTTEKTKREKVQNILKHSKADYIVVNKINKISDSKHPFEIYDNFSKLIFSGESKTELANNLVQLSTKDHFLNHLVSKQKQRRS